MSKPAEGPGASHDMRLRRIGRVIVVTGAALTVLALVALARRIAADDVGVLPVLGLLAGTVTTLNGLLMCRGRRGDGRW